MASVKMMNNLGAGRERLCGSHGERGAQGTLRAETASSNGRIDSGRCRGAQRDGVAVAQSGGGTARQTAGVPLPVALCSRYGWPGAAFLPGPQGWGSSLTAAKEPLPRGTAPGLPGWRTRDQLPPMFGTSRNNLAASGPAELGRSGFPKAGGRLTGTCNPSLAETANRF